MDYLSTGFINITVKVNRLQTIDSHNSHLGMDELIMLIDLIPINIEHQIK